jgi:hypothetical protein
MQTYDNKTIHRPKSGRLSWVASLTIALIGVAAVAVRADDITGTVAKAEPPNKQDGTLALCGREPMPTQHRHSYLAGRVALDPEHPPRFLSLFCGGSTEK